MAQNNYPDKPGSGVMYFNAVHEKKHALGPDFSGYLVLEMDYKAGERLYIGAWEKPTSRGTRLLSIKEDNYVRKLKEKENSPAGAKEVIPAYRKKTDDEDVPF